MPWRWYSEYETEIGDPSCDYYFDDSVYQRNYTKAKILVNPSGTSINVNLGESYYTLEGNSVSSVTLGAKKGIILLKR